MSEENPNVTQLQQRRFHIEALRHKPEWLSFQVSLWERIQEIQAKVNDLGVTGPDLDKFRVRRLVLEEIASGQMMDSFISDIEGRVKNFKEDAENAAEKPNNL